MVKTRSEKVLGRMILSRIGKIKELMKQASKLTTSDKRYRSKTARIIEDIYEITSELRKIEEEYADATKGAYILDDYYLYITIENTGYDLDDEEFLGAMEILNFKVYTSFIKRRLKK